MPSCFQSFIESQMMIHELFNDIHKPKLHQLSHSSIIDRIIQTKYKLPPIKFCLHFFCLAKLFQCSEKSSLIYSRFYMSIVQFFVTFNLNFLGFLNEHRNKNTSSSYQLVDGKDGLCMGVK